MNLRWSGWFPKICIDSGLSKRSYVFGYKNVFAGYDKKIIVK
jgi:hypothetical protein